VKFLEENTHTVVIDNYFYANWSKLVGDVLGCLVSVCGIAIKSETTHSANSKSVDSVLLIHLKVELACNNAHESQQGHNGEPSPPQRQIIRHSSSKSEWNGGKMSVKREQGRREKDVLLSTSAS
jgi:hypothetical protein